MADATSSLLWLPWALYVPGGLLLAASLVGVAVKIGGCRWSEPRAGPPGAPPGSWARLYGVVVAVTGTAVAGLVLCWLRLRSRSLLALTGTLGGTSWEPREVGSSS